PPACAWYGPSNDGLVALLNNGLVDRGLRRAGQDACLGALGVSAVERLARAPGIEVRAGTPDGVRDELGSGLAWVLVTQQGEVAEAFEGLEVAFAGLPAVLEVRLLALVDGEPVHDDEHVMPPELRNLGSLCMRPDQVTGMMRIRSLPCGAGQVACVTLPRRRCYQDHGAPELRRGRR